MRIQATDLPGGIFPKQQLRVYTFGRLLIEWNDPDTGQIIPLPQERLHGQNAGTALGLLKALLSCPNRFATRAWLNEQFWPTSRQRSAEGRLNDVVSSLRGLLRPKGSMEMLVHFVYGTGGQGAGFRLDAYPQLWCDADAFEWYVKHALLLDQRGQDSTACWERAFVLAERGQYLPEQIEDYWSRPRRDYLDGLTRDCVHRWGALLRDMGHRDEAILRLRSYWLLHPTDEDVLRVLLELLGEKERFGEAEVYYKQALSLLMEENHAPDRRTTETIEAVRALQIKRLPAKDAARHVLPFQERVLLSRPDESPDQELALSLPSACAHLLPVETAPRDGAVWWGVKLAFLLNVLQQGCRHLAACDTLQAFIDRELTMFDDMQRSLPEEDVVLSRRQALITLASLPTLYVSPLQARAFQPEAFFPQCAASITACWHLLRGRDFFLIEKFLVPYLPTLADLAHQSSRYQTIAAGLASQGYRLLGILALHRNNPEAREAYYQQAVHYAELADHPGLLTAALISLAYHQENPTQALSLYHRGLLHKRELTPLLLSRLYARFAVVSAQQCQEQEALNYLHLAKEIYPTYPEKDPSFLYAEFSPASLVMEEGLTYVQLSQRDVKLRSYATQAWQTFAQVHQPQPPLAVPARIHVEIINHQAEAALGMNDLERFGITLEKGVQGAKMIQSEQRMQEARRIYKAAKQLWPEERSVQTLAEAFV